MSKKSQQKCPLCNDVLPEDQEIEDHVNLFHKGYTVHFILEAEICSLRMRFSRKSFHLVCIVDLAPMAFITIKFENGFFGFSVYGPRRLAFKIDVDGRTFEIGKKEDHY